MMVAHDRLRAPLWGRDALDCQDHPRHSHPGPCL